MDIAATPPITNAASIALRDAYDPSVRADLLFLEDWERTRPRNLAAALRASQIRRANPDLASAIAREVSGVR